MMHGPTIGVEVQDAAEEDEAERLDREPEQDQSEVDDVNVVEVDSMEFWEFELLFETTKFVDDRLPGLSKEIVNEIINDIYDNLYDLVKEIHERESTKKEG